ncbi:MAG: YHYH protein, partial [Candidatus Kapaibacterium sp.]
LMEILGPTPPETIDSTFAAYKPRVKTRWDATYFYVESNGMPTAMPAMKGITAWQQQVPIPQPYTGPNAWAIPLNPVIADVPVSLDTALHTGAVAIAANGVPVFNPENNRGEFSQDIGELDAFGGHCGRADDYHYHIAPVHLVNKGAKKLPIAWALDGYKLFGFEEPDGTVATNLDKNLGHLWNGEYHYHAIDKKPYMIAAMRGKITIQNDQVMPQPRAAGVRTYLQALRGASITDMRQCDTNHFVLRYDLNGKTNFVNYRWDSTGKQFVFNFVKTDSLRSTVNYTRK